MKLFEHESQRYDYPLDAESTVFDCGAYHGDFAVTVAHRYGCRVFAFEPCREHFEISQATIRAFPCVTLLNIAVGETTHTAQLSIRGDSTSFYNGSSQVEEVTVIALAPLLNIVGAPEMIDLIKLNVEGSEYKIIEHMIETGIVRRFRNIQVQWHDNVPDSERRREKILADLLATHTHAWGENPRLHQSFQLR